MAGEDCPGCEGGCLHCEELNLRDGSWEDDEDAPAPFDPIADAAAFRDGED